MKCREKQLMLLKFIVKTKLLIVRKPFESHLLLIMVLPQRGNFATEWTWKDWVFNSLRAISLLVCICFFVVMSKGLFEQFIRGDEVESSKTEPMKPTKPPTVVVCASKRFIDKRYRMVTAKDYLQNTYDIQSMILNLSYYNTLNDSAWKRGEWDRTDIYTGYHGRCVALEYKGLVRPKSFQGTSICFIVKDRTLLIT